MIQQDLFYSLQLKIQQDLFYSLQLKIQRDLFYSLLLKIQQDLFYSSPSARNLDILKTGCCPDDVIVVSVVAFVLVVAATACCSCYPYWLLMPLVPRTCRLVFPPPTLATCSYIIEAVAFVLFRLR